MSNEQIASSQSRLGSENKKSVLNLMEQIFLGLLRCIVLVALLVVLVLSIWYGYTGIYNMNAMPAEFYKDYKEGSLGIDLDGFDEKIRSNIPIVVEPFDNNQGVAPSPLGENVNQQQVNPAQQTQSLNRYIGEQIENYLQIFESEDNITDLAKSLNRDYAWRERLYSELTCNSSDLPYQDYETSGMPLPLGNTMPCFDTEEEIRAYFSSLQGFAKQVIARQELKTGILIYNVSAGGAAEEAGLTGGEVILYVNDVDVASVPELAAVLADSEGAEVELKVIRMGQPAVIKVTPNLVAGDPENPNFLLRENRYVIGINGSIGTSVYGELNEDVYRVMTDIFLFYYTDATFQALLDRASARQNFLDEREAFFVEEEIRSSSLRSASIMQLYIAGTAFGAFLLFSLLLVFINIERNLRNKKLEEV